MQLRWRGAPGTFLYRCLHRNSEGPDAGVRAEWRSDKAFGSGVSEASPHPLAISFCTLPPLTRAVSSLLDAGPRSRAGEENRIGETFVCQVELHPRGERLGMGFVGHISVGYKTENTLLFFGLELLRGNLLFGITHSNCPLYSQNAKFDVG